MNAPGKARSKHLNAFFSHPPLPLQSIRLQIYPQVLCVKEHEKQKTADPALKKPVRLPGRYFLLTAEPDHGEDITATGRSLNRAAFFSELQKHADKRNGEDVVV
jgi:hypothetical protein